MHAHVHLISGLPRSGSTLLAALLRQNPRFSAGMTSPVSSLFSVIHPKMCGGEFRTFFDDAKQAAVLRAIVDAYYRDIPDDHVVFDTNRSWSGKAGLLGELYPQSRIICCVRDVGWIIDSFERMLNKNPLQLSGIFNFQTGGSVYSRVEILMNADKGLIGKAWSRLREAWFGENAQRLIIIPYEHLAQYPQRTLQRLYAELGEAPFDHDFTNAAYDEPEYDAALGMPGLHTIRPKVEHQERQPCIPPDIFAKYAAANFWEKPELNTRNVTIL